VPTLLVLEINGHDYKLQKEANLHPGLPFRWGNITIAPLAINLPLAPLLSYSFISDGHSVALVNNLPRDLHCSDAAAARRFDCSLDKDACSDCYPTHDIHCQCRELNLERFLGKNTRLPLTISKVNLKNEGSKIYVDSSYAPIQVLVTIEKLRLVTEYDFTTCMVAVTNFSGCYKCMSGAKLHHVCKTNEGNALAKVTCRDGTSFVTHCSASGIESAPTLGFEKADVGTTCNVQCPATTTQFTLKGKLYYIPISRRYDYIHRSAYTQNSNDSWSFGDFFQFDAIQRTIQRMIQQPVVQPVRYGQQRQQNPTKLVDWI
jgi:hypothetical protein